MTSRDTPENPNSGFVLMHDIYSVNEAVDTKLEPDFRRRGSAYFTSPIPHGFVGEVDDKVSVTARPHPSLVKKISPPEKHHVPRA